MKRRQLGISLLEVMLSLSIIAVVLVMATKYFFMASDSERVNQARAQIASVMAAATGWETGNNDLNQLTISSLVDERYLAKTTDVTGGEGAESLVSPWKTAVEIVGDPSSGGRAISMVVASNPTCLKLAGSFSNASCSDNQLLVPLLNDNNA